MHLTFTKDYGVYSKGLTYRIPDAFAADLIKKRVAIKAVAKEGQTFVDAQKIMKPSQVSKRGGL